MRRKTPKQRASEFKSKAVIRKKFKNLIVTDQDRLRLEVFFKKYLEIYNGEVPDSLYCTLGNLIMYCQPKTDLFEHYLKLKSFKVGTLQHYMLLYGDAEGRSRFLKRQNIISDARSLSDNEKVSAFLRKKCVSSILKKDKLSDEQLLELERLLLSKKYSDFYDNESIIVDIVLNFSPDFVSRYNVIKTSSPTSIEYFKARYADNYLDELNRYKKLKSSGAKRNFANCKNYWIARGLTDNAAKESAHLIQKERAAKAKELLTGRVSPRSIEFWINKGMTETEAEDIVRKIQTRDLDFYIDTYGEDEGTYRYQEIIQKRLASWYSRSEEDRNARNNRKGRTYLQLIEKYGGDPAFDIIQKRLVSNPAVSKESKDFFRKLDSAVCPGISKKSVTGYKGPERWIKHSQGIFFVDYIVENCIIEYNGSYWHADKRLFEAEDWHSGARKTVKEIRKQDEERLDILQKLGYKILIIWSTDVNKNSINEINKCKDFLNEHI